MVTVGARRRVPVNEIVRHTRARSTGATIAVERTGPGSWIEQDPGWVTVCVNHGQCCMHETRRLAESFAACPEEWCSDCRLIADSDRPRIKDEAVTG